MIVGKRIDPENEYNRIVKQFEDRIDAWKREILFAKEKIEKNHKSSLVDYSQYMNYCIKMLSQDEKELEKIREKANSPE